MTMKLLSTTKSKEAVNKRMDQTIRAEVVFCPSLDTYLLNVGGGTMLWLTSGINTSLCYIKDHPDKIVRELFEDEVIIVKFSK